MTKKYNTNSQTGHSKALRSQTATQRNKELRAKGLLSQFSVTGKTEEINSAKERLLKVEGNSYIERILTLLDHYEATQHKS